MKHFYLLLLSLICSMNGFSQHQEPDLYQTWYLRLVQSNDMETIYVISEITPAIAPTLTIADSGAFSGEGACNSFFGTFSTPNENWWETHEFGGTLLLCNDDIHRMVEDSYFGFMQSAISYQIFGEGDNQTLRMDTALMGQAVFQNFQLSVKKFDLESISVYPNPAHSVIAVNSAQANILKIQVVNAFGQTVATQFSDFERVDISDLSSGMYILKIETDFGTINKKIIKN